MSHKLRFRRTERGGVAVLTAVAAAPVLLFVFAAIDVSRWAVLQQELQRTVDVAAIAGAIEYGLTASGVNAANAAADLAELNGATGSSTRQWNAGASLLQDNTVTVQLLGGVRVVGNTAVKVTVARSAPLTFGAALRSTPVTLTATGWAEVAQNFQPCVLALGPNAGGVSAQGNVSVVATGCSIRSNGSISTGGASSLTASAFYAAGSITGSENGGPLHPNDGMIPDPYANVSSVQSALRRLSPGTGSALSVKPKGTEALSPGTWSSWDIKGSVTLAAGTYFVNGAISLGAQSSLSGTGVTIVTSGALSMTGGADLDLSAPLLGASSGIPGIVLAGSSSSTSSFLGNTAPRFTGVLYYPNGGLDFGGAAAGGSSGCLELVALSISLHGNPALAANCSRYGTATFASEAHPAVALVQ